MRRIFRQQEIVWTFFFLIEMFSASAYAATPEKIHASYGAISGSMAPIWVAKEARLFEKHGLDLKAIYAGRVRPQQLLATDEVPIVVASGTGTMTSHILGVKDQVLVFGDVTMYDAEGNVVK